MSNNKVLKPPVMMKLKRKRIGNTKRIQNDPYNQIPKQKKPYCHGDEVCKRQLMNPFQTAKKTQNLLEIKENNISTSNDLFNILSKPKSTQAAKDTSYILPNFGTAKDLMNGPTVGEPDSQTSDMGKCKSLPSDWSLKTDYKLQSTTSLKWCSPALLKPGEEAKCTANFAAAQTTAKCSDRERLRCSLSYWMHPNIAWLKLFPRDYPSISKSECTVLKQEALTGLMNEWTTSFESLFGLLKSGHCPFFYLCSHQTTVMFRMRDEELLADMVPTTYGVRTSLKQEDIEFTMPLAHELLSADSAEQENQEENEDTGEARDFLDSLGIDSKRYSELDPSVVKLRAAGRLKLDHSIRSLVRVTGNHVQGLFNYLLNDRSMVPTVGEFSGVPPTLLSPTVFVGGTVRHNQVKCGSSQARQEDGRMELVHYLHITGPLLPSSVNEINIILAKTQEQYSGKLSSLKNSSAYNATDLLLPNTSQISPQESENNPDTSQLSDIPTKDTEHNEKSNSLDKGSLKGAEDSNGHRLDGSNSLNLSEQKELNTTIYEVLYKDRSYTYR